MNLRPLITIGIPAHNEEANIKNLLVSILRQKQDNFELEKIIVISDGSTDDTERKVLEVGSPEIRLISEGKRLSKPMRINQIFSEANSDIVIIFDADIRLENDFVLENLVEPFVDETNVMLVSGNSKPIDPLNFVQKVVYTGIEIWDEVKERSGSLMYFCEGPVRAFRKELYKEIKFPPTSADDVYPYLFCAQKGYQFYYARDAVVRHKLPSTYADYLRQVGRYLESKNIHERNFDADFVRNHYTVTFGLKMKVFLKNLVVNPFWTIVYVAFLSRPKIVALIFGRKIGRGSSLWEIVKTTK